jgi:predicted short-subunit dehydrogenase-like oxidoreductase (DUF2520 family)
MSLTINIVGAGRIGKTIAKLCVNHKVGEILGVYNRSLKNAAEAVAFIGQGAPVCTLENFPLADITFITTPDDAIQSICTQLVALNRLKKNSIVVHCSGSLPAVALAEAKSCDCSIVSAHPMRSFADPALSIIQHEGTYYALEGEEKAIAILKPILDAMGAITYIIQSSKKTIYHTAGVFACNYLVTLTQEALSCLDKAGVPAEIAFNAVISLMSSTFSNLQETRSPEKALTGPVKRGDVKTLEKHLTALQDDVLMQNLYRAAALCTLKLTSLSKEKKEQITALLNEVAS